MRTRDPRLWRTVDGVEQKFCPGPDCGQWFARTPQHFHRNRSTPDGLQDWCRACMNNVTLRVKRRRTICMARAKHLARTLPPLMALEAITAAWADLHA